MRDVRERERVARRQDEQAGLDHRAALEAGRDRDLHGARLGRHAAHELDGLGRRHDDACGEPAAPARSAIAFVIQSPSSVPEPQCASARRVAAGSAKASPSASSEMRRAGSASSMAPSTTSSWYSGGSLRSKWSDEQAGGERPRDGVAPVHERARVRGEGECVEVETHQRVREVIDRRHDARDHAQQLDDGGELLGVAAVEVADRRHAVLDRAGDRGAELVKPARLQRCGQSLRVERELGIELAQQGRQLDRIGERDRGAAPVHS